jgi:hypothetical protein
VLWRPRVGDGFRLAARQVRGRHPILVIGLADRRFVTADVRSSSALVSHDHQILVRHIHPPAIDHNAMDPGLRMYTIRIKGQLGAATLAAFPALRARHEAAETVLTGDLDRAALHGVLSEIEALGLDLLEIRQLPRPGNRPDPPDGGPPR